MTQDAPSQGDSRVNGITKPGPGSDASRTIPEIYDKLRHKVIAFLEEQTDDLMLQNVQSQVRLSMGVIQEALCRYT
jgi:FAD synthetase